MGDIDLITDAEIDRLSIILDSYRVISEDRDNGEMVVMAGAIPVMISRFRKGVNLNGTPIFGERLTDDLYRRDFTVNTICADRSGNIVDPFDGADCLDDAPYLLKAVGEGFSPSANEKGELIPEPLSVEKNPLYILKGLAMMGSGDFIVSPQTAEAMKRSAPSLSELPASVLRAGFEEILCAKRVNDVFCQFPEIVTEIFPELSPTIDFDQHSLFQDYDLYEHLCKSVGCSVPDTALRYALLFHGAGKPDCRAVREDGCATYYGHGERSAILARQALERLQADEDLISRVCFIIVNHDLGELFENGSAKELYEKFSPMDIKTLLLFACANLRAKSPNNEQKASSLKKLADSITSYR